MLSAAIALASLGIAVGTGISNASAARKSARAEMAAMQEEKEYNLEVLRQEKTDKFWSDQMSQWRTGQSLDYGTSAEAVTTNNQNVLQRNIDFQESQYNIKLKNLKQQSKQRYLGMF